MKKTLMTGGVLLFSFSFSQKKDSITPARQLAAYRADKFPVTRILNVEFTGVTPYTYTSESNGKELPEGKVNSMYRLKASTNINFIKKPKWIVGTTLVYQYTAADVTLPYGHKAADKNFNYHTESFNVSYISRFFNKPAVYSGSLIVDGGNKGFERVRGMVSGMVVLKATPETQILVGLIGFVDPSSLVPVFPTFEYKHRFSGDWIAEVALPRGIYVRKEVFSGNARLSLGSELDNTFFYLYNFNNTDKTYNFSQLEINSGLIYEQRLGKYFIATLKGGLKSIPVSRIFEKNGRMNDYVFDARPQSSLYFNLGISLNPFALFQPKK
ncbi:DUF6268 family outer membrane beta-barrel protein [Elizabethkingia meningoseptica]|uniref:DUF6268 family outer membrane beta-barrel protein n=1 Tax=Elizabethkingia meningoseptica TaxID=238 RepID=UPI0023AE8145|nr:DUF6268 family outer membrane beta-barrel protein [Elizabethkingia meningoseptica]